MNGDKAWLEKRRAQQQRAQEAERLRQMREQADADRLAEAVEREADRRIAGELSRTFVDHGVGAVDRSAETAEQRRVDAIIARDRGDAAREAMRCEAEAQVMSGNFENLADTVVPPTQEWLEKGDTQPFTPKQPDGTVRVVSTVRRVNRPIVRRMHAKGKITDDQLAACEWYADRYEAAGLQGRVKTNHLSLTGNMGGGGGGMGQAPMAIHEHEAAARHEFRIARASVTAFYLNFLDSVVLHNIPISRAWRDAKCPKHKAEQRFRRVAQELVNFCESAKIEIKLRES